MIGEKMGDDIRNAYMTALKYPNDWAMHELQEAIEINDDHRRHTVMLDIYWGAQESAYD